MKGLKVIWNDRNHALVQSETREEVAHAVDLEDMTCSCENAQIDKNPRCKHIVYLEEVRKALQELREQDQAIRDGSPFYPTPPNDGDID